MRAPTDRRPGRIAANLGVSRAIARGLLSIPHPIRVELFDELLRVGPGMALAHLRPLPSVERP